MLRPTMLRPEIHLHCTAVNAPCKLALAARAECDGAGLDDMSVEGIKGLLATGDRFPHSHMLICRPAFSTDCEDGMIYAILLLLDSVVTGIMR